jgi:transposase-like protein
MKRTISRVGLKGQKGRYSKYETSFRREVARQYVEGNESQLQVALRNGVTRFNVKDWVKQFSGELASEIEVPAMTEKEQKEFDALKKQNEALTKKLDLVQMKNFALETLLDLAKTELGVDLRKNSGAKQPGE